jgi:hypothetical protein
VVGGGKGEFGSGNLSVSGEKKTEAETETSPEKLMMKRRIISA